MKLIDTLEMSESTADFASSPRSWSCTLSDGSMVLIKVDWEGNSVPLKYEDRERYCSEVRQIRMTEFDEQVKTCIALIYSYMPTVNNIYNDRV